MVLPAILLTIVALWMTGNLALRAYVESKIPQSKKPNIAQRVARTRLWLVVGITAMVLCAAVWLRAGEVSPTGITIALVLFIALMYAPRLWRWSRQFARNYRKSQER